ncbi:MAG: NUDIX hydrolase [Geovibrio sp.]|nr:NUDIX hydrolase [Geovibrio sp.]MCD8566917.1 NUDIX hydrolase [Geovibrio sp.]
MKSRWRFLRTEKKFADRVLSVEHRHYHFDGAGASMPFTVVNIKNWVITVPVTAEGKLVLVRQFRVGTDSVTYEFPGGAVDDGEITADAALRELAEETGYNAESARSLGLMHPNPAFMTNSCHCFLAENCTNGGTMHHDLFEETEPAEFTRSEVLAMVKSGEITHSITIAAIGLWLVDQG